MKRLPIISTVIVAVAVMTMIGLGLWQLLIRLPEKEAYLVQLAANPAKPPIDFPNPPVGDQLLFRRATARCAAPVSFETAGAGNAGFRLLAHCQTGTQGPGLTVQIGTTRDPLFRPDWRGGPVAGTISHAPSATPLIAHLFGRAPAPTLLLVADTPAPGLAANAMPTLDSVPNNHLAYAVQWFIFAGIAVTIYGLALRSRMRGRGK